jgi:hypothetical protein
MMWIVRWIGQHHPSTYMLMGAWVVVGTIAHPALTNYMVVMLLGPWMFVTRDLARIEGKSGSFSLWGLIGVAVALSVLIVALVTVRFVGI